MRLTRLLRLLLICPMRRLRDFKKWEPPITISHALWITENIEADVFPPDNELVLAGVLMVLYSHGKRDKAAIVLNRLQQLGMEEKDG